jgi:hypothetical protein
LADDLMDGERYIAANVRHTSASRTASFANRAGWALLFTAGVACCGGGPSTTSTELRMAVGIGGLVLATAAFVGGVVLSRKAHLAVMRESGFPWQHCGHCGRRDFARDGFVCTCGRTATLLSL